MTRPQTVQAISSGAMLLLATLLVDAPTRRAVVWQTISRYSSAAGWRLCELGWRAELRSASITLRRAPQLPDRGRE